MRTAFTVAWSVAIVVGIGVLPEASALVLLVGIVGWVLLWRVGRKAKESAVEEGALGSAPEPLRPPPEPKTHSDALVAQRVVQGWEAACVAAGVAVVDVDRTRRLRGAQRDAHRPEDALDLLNSAVAQHQLSTARGVVVQGTNALATPTVEDVRPAPAGPLLSVRLPPEMTCDGVRERAPALAAALRVPDVRVAQSEAQRVYGLASIAVRMRDPLASVSRWESVPAAHDLGAVPVAIGEDGRWRKRNLRNVSGAVVGGVPGSGKTLGEGSVVARLIQNPAVQILVIDGKGGADWAWLKPRAALYWNDDEDLEAVARITDQVVALRRQRMKEQPQRGASNFWDLPPSTEHPFVILIVDEVQTFTETKGKSKEDKVLCDRITANLLTVVKKGRSAGLMAVLMTQKPTDDAIPTSLRDNCSIRECFKVKSRAAAVAVLGDVMNESDVSPAEIPADAAGVAVVETADGLEKVRFPYIAESDLGAIATRTAGMRRQVIECENEGEDD